MIHQGIASASQLLGRSCDWNDRKTTGQPAMITYVITANDRPPRLGQPT